MKKRNMRLLFRPNVLRLLSVLTIITMTAQPVSVFIYASEQDIVEEYNDIDSDTLEDSDQPTENELSILDSESSEREAFNSGLSYKSAEHSYSLSYVISEDSTITITGIDKKQLGDEDLVVPNTINDLVVSKIGHGAFYYLETTGGVVLPAFLKVIEENAFCKASARGELVIPDSVEIIGKNAFDCCKDFSGKLVIPDSVSELGDQAFIGCSGFSDLQLSNSLITIPKSCFLGWSGATGELVIPNNVQTIKEQAFSQSGFEQVILSDSLETIENYAFWKSGLKGDLDIPEGVVSIGEDAFLGCEQLNGTVYLPSSLRSVGKAAFEFSPITEISFSEGMEEISDYLFEGHNLHGILIIPNSVKKIGEEAFCESSGYGNEITDIYFPATINSIGENAFNWSFRGGEGFIDATYHCVPNSYAWNWVNGLVSLGKLPSNKLVSWDGNSAGIVEEYKFIYDLNGAPSELVNAPKSQFYRANKQVVVKDIDDENKIAKVNFLGWSEDRNATSPEYRKGSKITIVDSDVILYAVWKKPWKKVSLSLNRLYHSETPTDYLRNEDATWLYELSLPEKTIPKKNMINISLEMNEALKENPECSFTIFDKTGKRIAQFVDGEGQKVNNPQNIELAFSTSDKSVNTRMLFKRIISGGGTYYLTVQERSLAQQGSIPEWNWISGLSGSYSIYVTSYRDAGFDLVNDSISVINCDTFFERNGDYFTRNTVNNTFKKKYFFKKFAIPGGHCMGLSIASIINYINNGLLPISKSYVTPNINENGRDTIWGYNIPCFKGPKGLGEIVNEYCLLQYSDEWMNWRHQNELQNPLTTIKTSTVPVLLTMQWNEEGQNKGHAVVTDSKRNPLYLGNDWYRVYIYDNNTPYDYKLTFGDNTALINDYNPQGEQIDKAYKTALNSFIDINERTGDWDFFGGINAEMQRDLYGKGQPRDGSARKIEASLTAFGNSTNNQLWTDLANSLSNKVTYNRKGNVGVSLFKGDLEISSNDRTMYKRENGQLMKIDDAVDEVPIIGYSTIDDKASLISRLFLPNGEYDYTLNNGYIDFSMDNVFIEVESSKSVQMEFPNEKSIILRTPTDVATSRISITRAIDDGEYCTAETSILLNNEATQISLSETNLLSIEASINQDVDLQLETEKGSRVIDNIPVSQIIDIGIRDSLEKKYKVSFDAQDGAAVRSIDGISEGATVELPVPTRENYAFIGWFTEEKGQGIEYTNKTPITQDITLYACWGEASDGIWIDDLSMKQLHYGYKYTGSPIRPSIKVFDGTTKLIENKDYNISYKNNVNAAEESITKKSPMIIVRGQGGYKGVERQEFTIEPKDVGEDDITVSDIATAPYNKKKTYKPVPSLSFGKKKLKYKADFTVAYYSDVNCTTVVTPKTPGTYYAKITGKKNFTGNRVVSFVIAEAEQIPVSELTIGKIADQPYDNGQPILPKPSIKYGRNTMLVEDTHYKLTYGKNTEVGTGTVVITGIEPYVGTRMITFSITGIPMNKVSVGGIPKSVVYDGSEKTTILSLSHKADKKSAARPISYALEEDYDALDADAKAAIDCIVTIKNNVNVGTATVTLQGIHRCSGTVNKTFKIKPFVVTSDPEDQFKVTLAERGYPFAKGGVKPKPTVTFNGEELKEGKDYTLGYANNTLFNGKKKPVVKVTGKGNYKGTDASATFAIVKADMAETGVKVIAKDVEYRNKAGKWISKISVAGPDGKALKPGLDYDSNIIFTDAETGDEISTKSVMPEGTVIKVRVNGKGAYTGFAEGTYRILAKGHDISKFSVSIAPKKYTGKPVVLAKEDIAWKSGKRTISGIEFEIDESTYKSNVNKGKASVVIRGTGDWGGSKTIIYTIGTKRFLWWWRDLFN